MANFVEVHLAKRGHKGLVGLNLLEKIQIPTLPSLFGAMLAGVDCVLMGAGIPRSIPRVLDQLAHNEPALLTAGKDANRLHTFVPRGKTTYTATDVIEKLLATEPASA